MPVILLTQSQVALVDEADYDRLMQWKWYARYSKSTHTFYALRGIKTAGSMTSVLMSRDILGLGKGDKRLAEHANRDTLDNRRKNLRIATRSQNGANRGLNKNNASGFKGVRLYKDRGQWEAGVRVNGQMKHLGFFATPEEAYEVYKAAMLELFGEFARVP